MKQYFTAIAIALFIPLTILAQDDYTSAGEKFPIHDAESKIDFELMENGGEKFLKVWVNTHLNLGCVDTSEYLILYLANGNDVDLIPTEKSCGKLAANKKHSDYEIYYSLPAESMEELRTHKVEYFELEAQHQTLERKADDFQELSKEHFETYFIKNLSE
jgi:hypothetical protein